MEPLKLYLGDLTHDTIVLVSDTIPINVGFVGSYAKKIYGDDIDVSLFKYPGSLIDAIKSDPPDVLALSNYSWNSHLSERVAGLTKQVNPSAVTVQGGTNFPHLASQHLDFLSKRPNTDFHVEMEGEISFSNLIGQVLQGRDGGARLFDRPVDGCVYIQPTTRYSNEPLVVSGNLPPRIRDLDEIPSPYLNGMLDHFFDGRLTPYLETNRGCPFKCTFCHTGNDYFQKTNNFSLDRIKAEINYIGPRVSALGIVNLHIADTNFGMYARDREICLALKEAHDKYGWPLQIMATTGKNNKERVIDITSIMGHLFTVNMSVQSMDQNVLSNIKRDNIKLEDYIKVNQSLNEQGRATKGELIVGLPGETRETFMQGLEKIVESGVSSACIYTLMLLNGTEFQDPAYRRKHGIESKFRIVPLDFGEYEGERVLDYEEVGIGTNDMSFDDYLYLRGIALLVEALHNGRPFEEFFRLALSLGISRTSLLRLVSDKIAGAPPEVRQVMDGFLEETQGELWDSGESLVRHYQEDQNYLRLASGEIGGNLIYKYKAVSLAFTAQNWIAFLSSLLKSISQERSNGSGADARLEEQIDVIARFCQNKLSGLLDVNGNVAPLQMESPYDIVGWMRGEAGVALEDYARSTPVHYEFAYSEEQLKARDDQFKRYGTDANALSKIVTRISNIESLMRKVSTPEGEQVISADTDQDRFTRYTMSR